MDVKLSTRQACWGQAYTFNSFTRKPFSSLLSLISLVSLQHHFELRILQEGLHRHSRYFRLGVIKFSMRRSPCSRLTRTVSTVSCHCEESRPPRFKTRGACRRATKQSQLCSMCNVAIAAVPSVARNDGMRLAHRPDSPVEPENDLSHGASPF